ncbi:MAG TPA: hypothetical protein VHC49_01600 [Mycobacteriales bacterium]|nr:hypothetical protein [Mycobacteriales bacterium]
MIADLARACAAREIAAAMLPAPFVAIGTGGPGINVELVPCGECPDRPREWHPPFHTDHAGWPVLSILSCEFLTERAVLPAVVAAMQFENARTARFVSRAVAVRSTDPAGLVESEKWLDVVLANSAAGLGVGPRTLPAASRRYPTEHRDDLQPRPFGPHPPAEFAALADSYRAARAREIERAGMPVRSGQERAPWSLSAS